MKKRKGFTLVELLVVIAILAVLATVSVVGYMGFTKKAHESNDIGLTTQMNTILQAEEVTNKPSTPHEAVQQLANGGVDVEKLTPTTDGYNYVYDLDTNRMFLLDGNKSVVAPTNIEYTEDLNVFAFVGSENEITNWNGYSIYLKSGFTETTLNISTGLDVGDNVVETINYNNQNEAKNIIIRSNDKDTTININGYVGTDTINGDSVWHYGDAQAVYVNSVGMRSYHEFGNLTGNSTDGGKQLYVKRGRVVVENSSNVNKIYIKEGATSDSFKVETPTNSEVVIDAADKNVINENNVSKSEGTIVPVDGAVAYSYQTKQSYLTLDEAIANGGKIKLLANINLGTSTCVINKDVEIDFFGYTVFGEYANDAESVLRISDANVVFNDSSKGVKGGVVDKTNVSYKSHAVYVKQNKNKESTLVINDGIKIENYSTHTNSTAIYYYSYCAGSELVINDVNIYAVKGYGINCSAPSKTYASNVSINNAKVNAGNYAVYFQSWNKNMANINNGEYITSNASAAVSVPSTFKVNGGTFNVWPMLYNTYLSDMIKAVIIEKNCIRISNESPKEYVAKSMLNGKETYAVIDDISQLISTSKNCNLIIKKDANLKVENYGSDLTDEHLILSFDIDAGASLTGSITTKSADIVKTGAGNINLAVTTSDANYELLRETINYSSSRVKESSNLVEVTFTDGTVTKYTQVAFERLNPNGIQKDNYVKVKLLKDWDWSKTSTMTISKHDLTIDLNGHNLTGTNVSLKNNAFITVRSVALTVEDSVGTGSIQAKEGLYCFTTYNQNAKLIIKSGSFSGTTTIAQCEKGLITIEDGNFKVLPYTDGSSTQQYAYTLNCIDANYKAGTANIIVKGGRFFEFDPSKNVAEGQNTNFVAEGYKSSSEEIDGFNYYTVSKL